MLSTILLCGSHPLLEAQNLSRTLLLDGEQDRYLVPRHESRLESKWRTVNPFEEPKLVPDLVKAFRNGLERCTQRPEPRGPRPGRLRYPHRPCILPLFLKSSQSACSRERKKQSGDRRMAARILLSWPNKRPSSKRRWTTLNAWCEL